MRSTAPASSPAIVRLIGSSRPAAIMGFVITVIVDAVNRQPRWTRTHIGKEGWERLPLIADTNTAASIIVIALVAWITTSLPNVLPTSIFAGGSSFAAVRWDATLALATTTTHRAASTQQAPKNGALDSTVAVANPEDGAVGDTVWGASENNETTKPLSKQISQWRHLPIITRGPEVVHMKSPVTQ